jgi:hypothetical protein
MVVNNLDVMGFSPVPGETDAPLIVYANAVLPLSATSQLFQVIGRRDPEIVYGLSAMQHPELP